jgi:3-methyladenine DNA glycosylase AlkD
MPASMTVTVIRRRMRAAASPARAAVNARFFKSGPGEYGEGDRFTGNNVPTLRKLSREFRDLPRGETLTLLKSPWHEERLLALLILVLQYQRGDVKEREAIHGLYLKHTRYINNWDFVDCSAEHIVGAQLAPGKRALLLKFARSKLIWERRIAILATFHYIKRGEFSDTMRIAAQLLGDSHDLIHKAVGWMLREVGKRNQTVEEAFLTKYATRMPRTMLRYAIERFPEPLRQRYLNM